METLCNTCDTSASAPALSVQSRVPCTGLPLIQYRCEYIGAEQRPQQQSTIFCLCILCIIRLQVSDLQAGQAVACPGFDMQSSIVLAAAELTVECGDTRMCQYNFPVSGQSQGLSITLVFTL